MGKITVIWFHLHVKGGRRRGSQILTDGSKFVNLVEGVRGADEVVDDVGLVGELLVHHHSQDAHLCGASVVELDRALRLLGLLGERLPRRPEGVAAVCEVPGEGALNVLHHCKLQESYERHDLGEAERGDLGEGRHTVRHVSEGEVRRSGQHARQAHVLLYDVAEHREHGDAAVLDLHVPEAVEALLVRIIEKAKRVPEAERGLRPDLGLKGHLHSRGRLAGGG